MAYGVIQFVEGGDRTATVLRMRAGHPTGADGVMDPLSAFIEESSPLLLRQGSPGALHMAMLWVARERERGEDVRVLGGEGDLGITAAEMDAIEGRGHYYEVHFGRPGERTMPMVLQHALYRPQSEE